MRVCSIEDCGRKHYGRGLCSKHWQQLPERLAYARAYHTDPDNKKSALARSRSPEGKAYALAYRRTAKGKEVQATQKKKPKARFAEAKRIAVKREIPWGITLEEYLVLRDKPCFYCGAPLPVWGHGLDRKDNDQGYFVENVVPCCGDCNAARGDRFTHQEMVEFLGPTMRLLHDKRQSRGTV